MHDGVCSVSSEDGGKTWRQGPVTQLPHAAARVAVSPVNRQRAWVAAYEAGVYRTDDGGASWSHIESYPSDYAHSVLADPADSDAVYAGSEPAALFRSDDGGRSWSECAGFRAVPESSNWGFHAPTRDSHVRDLVVSPANAGLLYGGIEVGGVVRSRDGGSTWQQLPGLDDDIHCLHLGTNLPQRVYAATASAPFRSNNGGDEWEKINDGLARRYTLHIAAAPDEADVVLVTVSENARRKSPQFYRSTDGGQSWTLVEGLGEGEEAESMVVAFEWDPSSPNDVYAGTDGGMLYHSGNSGESWEQLPVTLSSVAVGALAVAG
jgi:photosystem II stability/assembly factor-like uncharacterized protein